jgi:hypothetical protein
VRVPAGQGSGPCPAGALTERNGVPHRAAAATPPPVGREPSKLVSACQATIRAERDCVPIRLCPGRSRGHNGIKGSQVGSSVCHGSAVLAGGAASWRSLARDGRWRTTWPLAARSGAVPVWAGAVVLGRKPAHVADLAQQLGGQHWGQRPTAPPGWSSPGDRGVVRCSTAAMRWSRSPASVARSLVGWWRVTAAVPVPVGLLATVPMVRRWLGCWWRGRRRSGRLVRRCFRPPGCPG